VSPEEQGDRLERQYEGLLTSYGDMMRQLERLDERANTAERERLELRAALSSLGPELRAGLIRIDESCAEKVSALRGTLEASAKETRKEIKDEIDKLDAERGLSQGQKAGIIVAAIAGNATIIAALIGVLQP